MANTVDLNELQEFRDAPAVFQQKAKEVAQLVFHARHCILFTGAGISTSANIPDFRGPNGVWTRKAQGKAPPKKFSLLAAKPTLTHRTMKELVDSDLVKYIVSQNVDGLHLRSGIPRSKISELHGNGFLEVCWKCGEDRVHDKPVKNLHRRSNCAECRKRVPHFCHCSGNKCPKCGSMMKDSIIHFHEGLPKRDLQLAYDHSQLADVCIVAGSSCRVSPASDIPTAVGQKRDGALVIVNLQKTPLDGLCKVRVWGVMDTFFELVAQELTAMHASDAAGSAHLRNLQRMKSTESVAV